jgi:hypothetical protein
MNVSLDIPSSAPLQQQRDSSNERMGGESGLVLVEVDGVSSLNEQKMVDPLKKSEEDRDQPCSGGSSPQSVIAVFDEGKPRRRTSRRGIDSPMKRVVTRNVYESALKKKNSNASHSNSSASSATSASDSSSAKQHRRQLSMTSDSTHSKVAAVARGASKAAAETCDTDPAIPALLDRPVACPERQHTSGTMSDVSCDSHSHSEIILLPFRKLQLPPNRPAIRRPPRRDTMQGDLRTSIFRMKNSVLTQPVLPPVATTSSLPGNDQPAPCPVRLPTAEKQPNPNTTSRTQPPATVVSPKTLLSKFDRQTSADTRDDDTDSWSMDQDGAYFQPRPLTPSSDLVKAWLSMPLTPPRPQARVATPLATPQHTISTTEDDRTFGESSHFLTTPNPPPGEQDLEDESTMAHDTPRDNRIFQPCLKLPPKASCTTPNLPLPLHPSSSSFSGIFLQTPNHGRARSFGGVVPVGTPTLINRHITTGDPSMACLDLSAIEVSIDLSLPSFFADCRAQITDTIMPAIRKHTSLNSSTCTEPEPEDNISKQETASTTQPTSTKTATTTTTGTNHHDDHPVDAVSVSSQMSLSLTELVAPPKKDGAAMPPNMPHRRKPTLLVNNSTEEQESMFWTSMPIVLPTSPMNNHRAIATATDLRSSWPRIFDLPSVSSPPTIPNRFRRQDSLLPCEADNHTMVPPPPAPKSPPRRSSLPPGLPHRRKPSLDVSSPPGKPSRPHPQDYVPAQPRLWSSLPALLLGGEDDAKHTLPPAMPHRRKPSLKIHAHDTGAGEACIEMRLPQAEETASCCGTPPPSDRRKGRHQRHDSTPSIILKEGEMEI